MAYSILLSVPIGLFGLYLRYNLDESPIFEQDVATHQEEKANNKRYLNFI